MRDTILMLAKIAPFEVLVSQMEDAIEKWRLSAKKKEDENGIQFYAMVMATKAAIGDQSLVDAMKELDKLEKGRKLFDTGEN